MRIRNPSRRAAVLAAILAALASPAAGQTPTPRPEIPVCQVTTWDDGDSGRMRCRPGGIIRFRLADYDAPELRGGCVLEQAAAAFTHEAAKIAAPPYGPSIIWRERYRDRYGRSVGDGWLVLDGRDLPRAITDAGGVLAWWPHDRQGRALGPRPRWCGED